MRHVGVLGGTFDPIHAGHLALARAALTVGDLDEVLLAPAGCPPHKKSVSAPASARLDMCRLAVAGEERIRVTTLDMRREPSYTLHLVRRLMREYPDTAFTFLTGADKLRSMPHWEGARELFVLCDFLCFPRPGEDMTRPLLKLEKAGARVRLAPMMPLTVSSLGVREAVARGEESADVPDAVMDFIAVNSLYRPNYLPRLREMMNERRFRHTLGVRKTAVELARRFSLPVLKAAEAGVLHDCAKGMSVREQRKIAEKHGLTSDEGVLSSGALMHGMVGAVLAQELFGVRDEEVLDAIRYHTTGRAGMTDLDMCIFVADAIEPTREDYEGLAWMRYLAQYSLRAATLASLYGTRAYLEGQGKPFNSAGQKTIEDLEKRLSEAEKELLGQRGPV